jgi:hypothetical protein
MKRNDRLCMNIEHKFLMYSCHFISFLANYTPFIIVSMSFIYHSFPLFKEIIDSSYEENFAKGCTFWILKSKIMKRQDIIFIGSTRSK